MKPVHFLAVLAALALTLGACSKNAMRNGDPTLTAATAALGDAPIEGVYPDCKFGVMESDSIGGPACAKPTEN